MKNVVEVKHPLIAHSLTVLRDERTGVAEFRSHAATVAQVLVMEATRHLDMRERIVQTPLEKHTGSEMLDSVVLVPVLRAGLAMLNAAQELLPQVPVGFVGLERDEKTAVAREYYQRIPEITKDHEAIVLDPMLATGGSMIDTVKMLHKRGIGRIVLVCIVAAPEGIERVMTECPEATLYVGAIDSHLDENKFIVPGLGDFGDRYFGTV